MPQLSTEGNHFLAAVDEDGRSAYYSYAGIVIAPYYSI
jgi:hypothetical protein